MVNPQTSNPLYSDRGETCFACDDRIPIICSGPARRLHDITSSGPINLLKHSALGLRHYTHRKPFCYMTMSLWTCTSCSKSFTRKGDLTRHQLLHTGIKPHICKTCGKGFAQHSGLKTHWNVHTKDKPYVCGIGTCKKAFGDPSSRARHRKETHRREGVYKCVVAGCGTRIKRRSAFVVHLRKHGLDPTLIDIDSIVSQNDERGAPAPANLTSPDVQNDSHLELVQSRSVSPSFHNDSSGYYTPARSNEAGIFMDEWLGSSPYDPRQVESASGSNTFLPMLDQIVNIGPIVLNDCQPSNSTAFHFSGVFPVLTDSDNKHLSASPLNLPLLEPFLENELDRFQSLWSSWYSTDLNDGVSFSPLNNGSQQSLLYGSM